MINFAIVVAAVFLGGFFVYRLSRDVYWGWCALQLVNLYNFSFGVEQQNIGPLHLSPVDMVSISLLIAGIIRTLPRMREQNSARALGVGFLIIFLVSYLRGVMIFGFLAASNEARGFIGPLISLTYFLTVPTDNETLEKFVKIYMVYAWGLVGILILAYAGFPIGLIRWAHLSGGDANTDGRFLPAGAAEAIALCFVLALAWVRARRAPFWIRISPPVFFVAAILLRHRTVWMMLIAAVVMIPIVDMQMLRKFGVTLALSVAVLGVSLSISSVQQYTNEDKLEASTQNEDTWLWRVDTWHELVTTDEDAVSVLFGFPLGTGFWRLDANGGYTNAPPHSEYVSEYLRAGVIGTGFLLWYFLRPTLRLFRANKSGGHDVFPTPGVWAIVTVMILVYCITYSSELDALSIVAVAAAVGDRVTRENRQSRFASPRRKFSGRQPAVLQGN